MDVSIVIPTYNRARLLRSTIPALSNQRTTGFQYEVIFVSNGSSDDTESVLKEAATEFDGKIRYYVIAPTGGPSAPRNVGIRAATGDIVIILDDDVMPDPDLVLQHVEFHRAHPEPHRAAIGEVYVPARLMDDPMSLFHTFPYDEVRRLPRLSYLHFWTCNVSFKRSFMLEKGMFDEKFLYFEDVVCAYKLAAGGMELSFAPAARGEHLHQLKPEGVPAKGLFTGLWLYAFLEKVPDLQAKLRFGVLSADLPAPVLVRRVLSRAAFRLIDNPLTFAALRWMGATGGKRSRITDLYYRLIFRQNLLAGYAKAKSEARAGAGWVDRGEP